MAKKPNMKALIMSILIGIVAAGCCTSERTSHPKELVMVRNVPVAKYKETLSQMVEEIEKQNIYEAMDVKDYIYNGHVTIAVYAERMSESRLNNRSIVKLQNEVVKLKRENDSLKKELELIKKGTVEDGKETKGN